jgi:hemoglobin-like flavoprotein
LDKTEEEIVMLMMPVYYCADILTKDEHKMASASWQLILNNTAPGYLALKKNNPNFKFTSSILFFYDTFYLRLFDIHPLARDLFKDAKSQGKFLVKMISLSLSEHADVVKYEKTLIKLAEIHNERGVKAIECKGLSFFLNTLHQPAVILIFSFYLLLILDGLVGEVLFWSIRAIVGAEAYTYDIHQAWVKIYSRMLRTMVPVAVAHELKDGSAQEKRFFGDTIGLSAMEESILKGMSGNGDENSGFSGDQNDLIG